jgi:YNFM family putative membrane transporter
VNPRYLAVAACGASAFLDMYATQPLLPTFRSVFGASEAAVGATISSLTLGCALAAPFVGPLADRIGRKRVIVSTIFLLGCVTLAAAGATTLASLVAWRFVQGLLMPGIFAVTLAYMAEEFPASVLGRAAGAYVAGNVFGGFLGRYVSALVTAHGTWQNAFVVLGTLNLLGAAIVWFGLPRARNFARSTSLAAPLRAIGEFLRNPVLLADYAVGSAVLFTMVAAFTYVTFYLAAPPFALGTVAIGNVFFVYLLGLVATPLAGRLVDRVGHRLAVMFAIGTSIIGMLLTLAPSLPVVIAGLALMSAGVFSSQTATQSFLGVIVQHSRSTAAALYLTAYYAGGGLGAILPAPAWTAGGWNGIVALIVSVEIVAGLLAFVAWRRIPAREMAS